MSISPNGTEIEESVHPCEDRAAKKAEEIAREIFHISYIEIGGPGKDIVAAELRKAYRLAELESEAKESSWNHINLLEVEIARLRAELAKVKA